jgi:glutathione S-transferase
MRPAQRVARIISPSSMKLYTSRTSPYARKVRVVLAEKKIECEFIDEDPWSDDTAIPRINPLGKIPVLMLDDGTVIYDSRVIVEYLDTVSPVSRLIPEPNRQRIAVRRWEALADGICDAAIAIVREQKRPAKQQSKDWIDRHFRKIRLGVQVLAMELEDKTWCNGEGYSLADIATGCALGYLDLRHPAIDWRSEWPNLVKLTDRLAKRPSFAETAPPPQ